MRHFAAELSDLAEDGDRVRVEAGERDILVCRSEGELFAINNRCSHANIPMHKGRIRRCAVTCPSHLAQFHLNDGSVKRGPVEGDPNNVSPIEVYELVVENDQVYIEIPE